jgi:serine/threonine-protein kinase
MSSVPDEHAAPGGAGEVRGNGLPETISGAEAERRRAGLPDADGAEAPGEAELVFEVDEAPSVLADPAAADLSRRDTIVWPPGRVEVPAAPGGAGRVDRRSSADFGKYELLCELGRGGMGVVYKARHKELDRIVAIKMILASHLASPEQVERFYAEARAASRLNSAQVVGIHDVGQIHGQHYFAMDYVPGPSLAEVVREGPLDPATAARYVYGVARAVALLHQHGIVHRDLKPSNVLLDDEGRVRVTDFGLAKMLQAEGRMTRSGAIVGTPGYMAPEQAAGKGGDVGPASDLYSLGAILYELLVGRPPFSGETPLDTLVQVLEGEPVAPGRLRPGIPREIEVICLTCLERAPGDRYPTAAALAEDLDRFLRGEQIEARPRGVVPLLRRWARREPALASRLGTMGICGAIIQANHTLIQPQEPVSHRRAIAVVSTWALASVGFQALLNRERNPDLVRLGWAAADVIMYTLLVWINQGLQTSLVAGYFLLVAASGLWFREHIVWFTTAMAVTGYSVLVLNAGLVRSIESPYRHVVFVAALAVSGLITGYQVRRVRALSQYYEHRPLP